MPLYITSLNSGSNGNCYYVGNDREAILVDAGISCRETEKRMKRLGLAMQNVKAIFVSHEHSDHINGIPVIAKKYELPVYITKSTLENCRFKLQERQVRNFTPHETVHLGSLSITAFPKFHDASEPHSFVVNGDGVCVGIFTDIGSPCDNLSHHFRHCHAAFLESNYDEQLLENGRYPVHLKNRIRGGYGHLSNKQALDFFISHRPAHMACLILSHLSKENNSPELVQQLFGAHAGQTTIIVASRFVETSVVTIHPGQLPEHGERTVRLSRLVQASLF